MILFTILALMLLILVGVIVLVTAVGGAVGTILFSDVIMCIVLIGLIIKLVFFRKKK